MKAQFIQEVTVMDPDSNLPVEITIYKEQAGGMFGVDSSYLTDTDDPVHSPFGNGILDMDRLAQNNARLPGNGGRIQIGDNG
ncbi:hypothetical protein GCM10028806_34720 [Spirosoma terrae]